MTAHPAAGPGFCGPAQFVVHSRLDVVQFIGATLLPVVAVLAIVVMARRHPTDTPRWTSRRITRLLGMPVVMPCALLMLAAGVVTFGASIFIVVPGGPECANGFGALGALGLLITICGAMLAGVALAVNEQAGWIVLATFFGLDLWIVFGMLMMHMKSMPQAPDPMLLLAFLMHAVCMYLTMVWGFHARNLNTLQQVRAGEAGRSIGAVWVFLAAYIVVGFFRHEDGPFDSAAGGAVLSALTLSALALTMGSGYTKYREVMDEAASARHPVGPAVDVHRVTTQEPDQRQPGLGGQIHRQ